jgi:hypothetical protein
MSKTNWPEPNMMLAKSEWAKIPSFSLLPITENCPFVECLYNPMAKTLAIIGKSKKDTFHMIPRLDDNGHPQKLKIGATQEEPFKKQRVQQESYSEYYLTDKSDVETFIKNFAINHEDFDYSTALDMETMSNPDKVAKGPQIIKQ